MSSTYNKAVKDFAKTLQDLNTNKPSAYDTQAEVLRVEGNTAWVHIPGGVDETPVQLTTNAKKGDIVQVRIAGGSAWLYGNATAPPTDDTKAISAENKALLADEHATDAVYSAVMAKEAADSAQESADKAKAITDEIETYSNTVEKTVTQILQDGETASVVAQKAQDNLKSVVKGATTVEKAVSVMQTALEAVVDYDPTAITETFTGDGTTTNFTLQNEATNILSVTVDGESVEYTTSIVDAVTVVIIAPAPDNESSVSISYDTTREYFWHDNDGAHVLSDDGGYRNDITSMGMKIMDTSDETSIAEFGDTAVIGKSKKERLEMSNASFTAYNPDDISYFNVDYDSGVSIIDTTKLATFVDTGVASYTWTSDDIKTIFNKTHKTPTDFTIPRNGFRFSFLLYDYNIASIRYVPSVIDSYTSTRFSLSKTDYKNLGHRLTFRSEEVISFDSVPSEQTGTITIKSTLKDDGEYITGMVTWSLKRTAQNSITILIKYTSINEFSHTGTFKLQRQFVNLSKLYHIQTTTTAPSYSLGYRTPEITEGAFSTIIGESLTAEGSNQLVVGKYNDNKTDKAFEIGNGNASNRSNALTVDWDGKVGCGDYSGRFNSIFDIFYPVGSYYETSLPSEIPSGYPTPLESDLETLGTAWFNPEYAWGGTWELEAAGMVHVSASVGAGTDYEVSGALTNTQDGGEETHVLTAGETGIRNHVHAMGAHTHNSTSGYYLLFLSTSGNKAVNRRSIKPGTGSAISNIYYGENAIERGSVIGGMTSATNTGNPTVGEQSGSAHNNMQPYINVNRWHRTA